MQSQRKMGTTLNFRALLPVVLARKATERAAHCLCCNRECTYLHAYIHQRPPPCVNFSPMGDRAGDEGAGLRHATSHTNATLAISGNLMTCTRSCVRRD
eukprot:10282643-Alexandrium_andersonii.AAC.1